MFSWRVQHGDEDVGVYGVFDPSGRLVFVLWEPMDPDRLHLAVFVAMVAVYPDCPLFYLDPEGTCYRGFQVDPAGPVGEYGWLIDLLREQTSLPWMGCQPLTV